MSKLLFAVSVLAASVCLADGSPSSVTSAWSTATCVDTRPDVVRFAKDASPVAYAPRYSGGTSVDHVILRKVQYAGTSSAVTNVVETFAAGAEGGYAFSFAAGDERCYRLLHTAYDANNAQVGETLAADVAFAVTGTGAANTLVDSRENSLQEIAEDEGTAPFAYDTGWATNGTPASLEIECECLCRTKGGMLIRAKTNTVFDVVAPAVGDWMRKITAKPGGDYTFKCLIKDADGRLLGPEMVASYSLPFHPGFVIIVR